MKYLKKMVMVPYDQYQRMLHRDELDLENSSAQQSSANEAKSFQTDPPLSEPSPPVDHKTNKDPPLVHGRDPPLEHNKKRSMLKNTPPPGKRKNRRMLKGEWTRQWRTL